MTPQTPRAKLLKECIAAHVPVYTRVYARKEATTVKKSKLARKYVHNWCDMRVKQLNRNYAPTHLGLDECLRSEK